MQIQGLFTSSAVSGFDRDVRTTLDRLNAGLTVRPRDGAGAAAAYDATRLDQVKLETATGNLPRALAYTDALGAALADAAGVLDELRTLYVADGAGPDAADRVAGLLNRLDHAHDTAAFRGNRLFAERADTPAAAPAAPVADPPPADPDAPEVPRGEVLRVTLGPSVGGATQAVAFDGPLENAVVIATAGPSADPDPLTLRVTDVTENGATVRTSEFAYQDGVRGVETVNLLALEAGTYDLSDGRRLEVGTVETSGTATRVNFNEAFDAAPVVFLTVQSENDATPVVARQGRATTTGVDVFLQREELLVKESHGIETVGYIAISEGTLDLNGITLTAVQSPDAVDEDPFVQATGAPPADDPVAFASLTSFDGSDPAYARLESVSAGAVTVSVQEESSRDAEQQHTRENVGVLLASGPGAFAPPPPPAPPAAADPIPPRRPAALATTGQLAFAPNAPAGAGIHRDALGDGADTLSALLGSALDVVTGDRARAVELIDAARGQIRRARVRTDAFARHELNAVDRVTRNSLAVASDRRVGLETAAGSAAADGVAGLTRRAAGLALAERGRAFQAEQLTALLSAAGGRAPAADPRDAADTAAAARNGELARLTEALAAYNAAGGVTPPDGTAGGSDAAA